VAADRTVIALPGVRPVTVTWTGWSASALGRFTSIAALVLFACEQLASTAHVAAAHAAASLTIGG
jgi:hypothetical protein